MSETARPRLLIVESDESVRRVLQRALAGSFEITPLASGNSALGRLKEERFDVVLLDLALRDLPAVELLRQLREGDEKVPVIITTPCPDPIAEAAVQALGVLAILAKPFNTPDLRAPLERALELALKR